MIKEEIDKLKRKIIIIVIITFISGVIWGIFGGILLLW